MTPGVTCRFIGRLGNNMFQAAACIGYAKKHKVPYYIPALNKESPRFYEFFPAFDKKIANIHYSEYHCHAPDMFNYKDIPFKPLGVKIVGFVQSEKYFLNAKKEVKKMFKLNYQKGYEDYVSVHVRRGDYVKYAHMFPPITVDYVNQAMAYFPGKKMLIFSDDLKWCEQQWPGAEFPNGDELTDLSLMASCGDHIIANSTFSWWGAWLGINPGRTVVTPHHTSWFGKNNGVKAPPVDLLPKEWIQIKFR